MTAGSIVVDLLMRTGSFETDTKRAEARLRAFRREAQQIGKAVGTAFVLAGTAVVTAFTTMIARGREFIDQQAKMAQQLTTTYESIETLARAGELAGLSLQQIGTAGRTLEVNLGKAAQGVGAQERAVAALGLTTEQLIALPLDEKIATINRALAENVDELERAAVAGDLFGTRNGAAIALLSPETIAQAARETKLFGLALSDVDAAQVELANDAMGTLGTFTKGLSTQLTVQFAPILRGIGEEFLTWAENSGGMQNAVLDAFEIIVNAAGFVADAIAGIGRVFQVTADVVIIGANGILSLVSTTYGGLARLIDLIPGIDISDTVAKIDAAGETAESVVDQAWQNIKRTLEEPLPSDRFDEWLARVRETTAAAAEATVAARDVMQGGGGQFQGPPLPTLAQTALPESAFEKMLADLDLTVAGFDAAAKHVERTRTQVERLQADIAGVQQLMADGFLTDEQGEEIVDRLTEQLERATQETNVFLEEASRGTQRILADTIKSGFDEGADGIADRFGQLLQDLAAEAIAANIGALIFGGEGVGSGGGLVGAAADFFSGFFGGGRAGGGGVSAGSLYRVNEIRPEYFKSNTSGAVMPMGTSAGGLELHIHNEGAPLAVDRTERSQGPDGRSMIHAWVRSEVQTMVASGELDRALGAGYGLRRRPS